MKDLLLTNRHGLMVTNSEFKHPEDGFYQIEVPGDHYNAEAEVLQRIDAQAVDSIVKTFNTEAEGYQAQHGVAWPGMVIDIEHFKHEPNQESRAYGWLMKMENRNGIPFGQIRWTGTGKAAVDGGDYRFFSTEYRPPGWQNVGKVDAEGDRKGKQILRPTRLAGLTLTNMPNNKGGSPITNREGVNNGGTSEGAKAGWEARRGAHQAAKEDNATVAAISAHDASNYAKGVEKYMEKEPSLETDLTVAGAHHKAAAEHAKAAAAHEAAGFKKEADEHRRMQTKHTNRGNEIEAMAGATDNKNTLSGSSNLANDGAATNNTTKHMKDQLLKLLGLPADATDEVITTACNKFVATRTTEMAASTTLKNRIAELETQNKELLAAAIEHDIADNADLIEDKEAFRALLVANRESALATIAALKKGLKPSTNNKGKAGEKVQPPLHKANNRNTPAPVTAPENSEDGKLARKISNRAIELRKSNPSMSFHQSWELAEGEFVDRAEATPTE